jgi:hypothetical protein
LLNSSDSLVTALVDPASFEALLGAAQVCDKRKLIAPDGGHVTSAVETMVQPILAWLSAHAAP